VTKYVCKGSEIASWPPSEILAFIRSIQGKRFFGTFGTMFHKRGAIRAMLNTAEKSEHECRSCGTTGCAVFIPDITMAQSVIAEHFL
jgi:hypothetical protein